MFDARSWIESQKFGSEIEIQMKYFCLYDQEYRDAINKIINGHRLNFIKFDELIDWIPKHEKGLNLMKKVMNQYAKDTPLKELHSSCVQDFSSAFCQLDEEEQKEVKNYIKICKESSVNPKEIQVSILEQIMKGSTEETEPLHELVRKGMKDPSNIPGGGNKKFETFPNWDKTKIKNSEYIALFPNVMIGLHIDHFYVYWLEPLAMNKTREHMQMYYIGNESANGEELKELRKENSRFWSDVMAEDVKAIEGMQEGRSSPVYNGGNFSPVMDQPTHQFHKWVASSLL